MQWDLTGSSLGDSPKGSRSLLGAHREIIGRRSDDLPQECRRLPDWQKLGLSLSLFVEGIEKLARNTSGDHRKKTIRLTARMLEATGLAGGLVFTQRRSVVDTGVPQGGEPGSGHRPVSVEPL
ncbi:hypothetical protein B296_00018332 [Ensete ventricosum]|uniref:Uncharacterized protein n=1 Tax=Ensete ventricosum TaxID=4639 RepID=A0A426XJS3_ENSVE|nr:hypothetical protein B296_00018332 [Ensete ventricosum]